MAGRTKEINVYRVSKDPGIFKIEENMQNNKNNEGMLYAYFVSKGMDNKQIHDRAYEILSDLLHDHGFIDFRIEKTNNNKPVVLDKCGETLCHISLSHCRGLILVGISNANIGVDAEDTSRIVDEHTIERISKRLFSKEDNNVINIDPKKFLEVWTIYESLGKLLGFGLTDELKNENLNGYARFTVVKNGYIISAVSEKTDAKFQLVCREE